MRSASAALQNPITQGRAPHGGGYEERHSALDMGSDGGLVAPGRPTPYVPSTVLFVRRSAVHRSKLGIKARDLISQIDWLAPSVVAAAAHGG